MYPIQTSVRSTAALLTLLAVVATGAQSQTGAPKDTDPGNTSATAPVTRPSPRYLLQGGDGQAVYSSDFADRFQLIAFGYVSCPDVCPTTLFEMQQILAALGERAKHLQPIFISVDPQRDSPAVLKAYAANFDRRILGLTGSEELVRFAANNFNVTYTKIKEPGTGPNIYTMEHTAGMFLVGPDGQLLKKFGYSTPVEKITAEIEFWLNKDGK